MEVVCRIYNEDLFQMYSSFQMRTILGVLCICLLLNVVHGRSGGAPDSACAGVSPDASFHGAGAQTSTSPFTLTIQGNPTEYIPGQQYTCEWGE